MLRWFSRFLWEGSRPRLGVHCHDIPRVTVIILSTSVLLETVRSRH